MDLQPKSREGVLKQLAAIRDDIALHYKLIGEASPYESDVPTMLMAMVNSLANMLIDTATKGYVSCNDLDYANECLDFIQGGLA